MENMWDKILTEDQKLTQIGQVLIKFKREELKNIKARENLQEALENLYGQQAQVIIERLEKSKIIPKVEEIKNG